MAAIFYVPQNSGTVLFKNAMQVNTSINIPFLHALVGTNGFSVISEVTIQNRDTIQYFLTFDDFISYFYFGKGLGSITISGVMFSDCNAYFHGASILTNIISRIRGTTQQISFGNVVFDAVISQFTIRASADEGLNNAIDFNIQMDIINHSLISPSFQPLC